MILIFTLRFFFWLNPWNGLVWDFDICNTCFHNFLTKWCYTHLNFTTFLYLGITFQKNFSIYLEQGWNNHLEQTDWKNSFKKNYEQKIYVEKIKQNFRCTKNEEIADLITFTEEILNGKLYLFVQCLLAINAKFSLCKFPKCLILAFYKNNITVKRIPNSKAVKFFLIRECYENIFKVGLLTPRYLGFLCFKIP